MKKLLIALFLFYISFSFGQSPSVNEELTITHLTGDFYIFTTYKLMGEKKQPANGMYLVTTEGVVLFDSPWDTSPFHILADSISARHHKKIILCLATHSHEDRTSGLDYFRKQGAKTFTTLQTDEISVKNERSRAEFLMYKDTSFSVGGYEFQTYYAGEGHTKDNIVIWFEKEKILYGGCLVKSTDAKDLGYVGEANLMEWPKTIKKVQAKCKDPQFIIPGHYDWRSKQSLVHTLRLLEK
ncbi:MAG TPA: BlaB/IND/MUS family subclass B1 metallo-beta-lactamase [Bacteroidia bacterium]|jgi:metallo-beta-lactamase class B|nr:BlaB/IND/MUS family subclass B1 metallo-beta-lactamase [Bacteroidia bacterium]